MKFGNYSASSVNAGRIWLDGGSMFGTVPRILWEKKHVPDAKHRIELAMRALLVEGEGRKILVDCGVGEQGGEKFKEMFRTEGTLDTLDQSLAERGVSRDTITDVVLSHLHFDHAGGATMKAKDGKWIPSFPNATYYVQRKNLEAAQHPNERERASYLKEIYEPLLAVGRLRLIDGPGDIFPGIEIWVSRGHTESQQHVVLKGKEGTLFYGGDLIPTSTHVPLPWIMGYDLHPLQMLEEKKAIFARMETGPLILFYEHDPKVSASRIRKNERGYEAGEIVEI